MIVISLTSISFVSYFVLSHLLQMQAFDITAGKFSPVLRCGQVGFGLGVATPFGMHEGDSDGVQMTVFTITVLSSISTVLGYALYRSFFVKSYDYQEEAI